MPQQTQLKSVYIPAPLAGLNLISPPIDNNYQDGEAPLLDNYFIYDFGIKERGAAVNIGPMPDAGNVINMFAFTSMAINKQYILLSTSATNTYLYDGTSISSWHAGTNFTGAAAFNKKIILPIGGVNVDTFDIATGARTAGAFTTAGNSIGSFVYNNRVYFWNNLSSVVEYGGVGEIAHVGALATFDFGQVFQKGQNVIFGTAWSYNQGVNNQDFLVIGNEAGEILIYSGDYPAAPNWQLVTKLQIPAPLTLTNYPTLCGVVKNGQDILINTLRGVISLASVMAGRNDQTGYYALSRNLGPTLAGGQGDISLQVPFAYFPGLLPPSNTPVLYVLNYERGSWSRFSGFATNGYPLLAIACQTPPKASISATNISSYVLISTSDGKLYKLSETATTADSGTVYEWQTPFMDFDSSNRKTIKRIDIIAKDNSITSTITNSAYVAGNFNDVVSAGKDSGTISNPSSDSGYQVQELRPASSPSQWLSVLLAKVGSDTSINEIAGMWVWYEESSE